MDPYTGNILAMASRPDFDLNNPLRRLLELTQLTGRVIQKKI